MLGLHGSGNYRHPACQRFHANSANDAVAASTIRKEVDSQPGYQRRVFRFYGADAPGRGPPVNISGGDGSKAAFERIRGNNYQYATVAEPLSLHGWQLIDEANRALSGTDWSGYVAPTHLVTKDNIGSNGGPNNVYDPDNGYRDVYKKIWGI